MDQKKITTVILDGGANEIILEGNKACLKKDGLDSGCGAHIARVTGDLSGFVDTLIQQGVTRIVYSGYYHLKHTYRDYNAAVVDLNASIQALIEARNAQEKIEIVFVDQRETFEGDDCQKLPDCPEDEDCYDHYLSGDKLHPSPYGSEKLADNIFNVLK